MIMDTPGQSVYDLGTLQENFTKVLSVRRSQSIFFFKTLETIFCCYVSLLAFLKNDKNL